MLNKKDIVAFQFFEFSGQVLSGDIVMKQERWACMEWEVRELAEDKRELAGKFLLYTSVEECVGQGQMAFLGWSGGKFGYGKRMSWRRKEKKRRGLFHQEGYRKMGRSWPSKSSTIWTSFVWVLVVQLIV